MFQVLKDDGTEEILQEESDSSENESDSLAVGGRYEDDLIMNSLMAGEVKKTYAQEP